jgi:hypothetical protein
MTAKDAFSSSFQTRSAVSRGADAGVTRPRFSRSVFIADLLRGSAVKLIHSVRILPDLGLAEPTDHDHRVLGRPV